MSQILIVSDLYKSFGLTEALRGTSISLHDGEIVVVMGPSGSGKSTLLHFLAGIVTPDSGEVHFGGRRINELPTWSGSTCGAQCSGSCSSSGSWYPNCQPW
jgi:putative ABC transport system ATP-binding protein